MRTVVWPFAVVVTLFLITHSINAQTFERYRFDIASQSVSSALIELALERELNLVYLANLTKDIQANAIEGEYSLSEALDILLVDSGLRATITNNRMIQIERVPRKRRPVRRIKPAKPKKLQQTKPEKLTMAAPEAVLPERIEVVARIMSPYNLGSTVSSTKTQRDFLATPQIVNALPEGLSKDTSARNYTDTVSLASSVTYLERSSGVADELRLRGFAYPALKINGVGAHAYVAPVDLSFIDSIEVAKGPGSVLFGRMEPGGVINMMLKKPGSFQDQVSIRHGSDDYQRADLDMNWALTDDTEVRTIGFVQRKGTEQDLNLDDADGLMLALRHLFDDGGELNINYRFESQNVLQQFGSPIAGFDSRVQLFRDEEGEIEVITSRQEDVRSGLDVDRNSLYLGLNDLLIGDWSADFHLQYDQYKAASLVQYPVIEEFIVDVNGDLVSSDELTEALLEDEEVLESLLEGLQTLSVDSNNIEFEQSPYSYDTQFLSAEFTIYKTIMLGDIELEQLYGVNLNRSKPQTLVWQTHDSRSNFIPTDQSEILFNTETTDIDLTESNAGLFGQWVFDWENLTTFLGARVDYLDFKSGNNVIEDRESFVETSLRLGAVYKLTDVSSIYFNYSESFSPQFSLDETPSTPEHVDYPEPISRVIYPEPAPSKQLEFGIKRSWLNDRLQTSCALFDIEKSEISSAITKQRNKGLDCDVAGSIGQSWHLTLGLSRLDAEILESGVEEFIGKRPRMAPEQSYRMWLNKDIKLTDNWRSRWGVGISYVGERFIEAENVEPLPAYTVVDFGASFQYGQDLTLAVMVRNLFDEEYTQGAFNALPHWTNPGPLRSIESRISYSF